MYLFESVTQNESAVMLDTVLALVLFSVTMPHAVLNIRDA